VFLDPAKLTLFFVAAAVLIVTPGPAVLYIVTRSISQGRGAGFVSALGVGAGNFLQAIAAALGLSAIIASSALAFSIVKYVGAIYLIYLGVKKFRSPPVDMHEASFIAESGRTIFWQGLLVELLNPKTALFFLAFLPQFAAPERGSVWAQLLVLGSIVAAMCVISDSCYAFLSGTFGAWLKRRKRFLRNERYLSGTVYCGLGVATAFSGSGKSS
jgi:threonine/homoserine/homoserine lactone efflux protein